MRCVSKVKRGTSTPSYIQLILVILLIYIAPAEAKHEPCHHDEVDAKKQGVVNFSTTLPLSFAQEIGNLAMKEFGFLKINIRSFQTEGELLNDMTARESSPKDGIDVVLSTASVSVELKTREKDYPCPQASNEYPYQEHRADRDGHWTAFALLPRVLAYNTRLVMLESITNYTQLTARKDLIGKIIVPSNDDFWFFGLRENLGPEKATTNLTATRPMIRPTRDQALTSIIAGDAAAAMAIYPWLVISAKDKGAPVDYIAIKPVISSGYTVSGLRTSPHPDAGRLFIKYLFRRSTQEKLNELGRYAPANKAIPIRLPKLEQRDLSIPDPAAYARRGNESVIEYRRVLDTLR